MKLQGSCYCGAVTFSCESKHPYPYQHCYCGICRKTAGNGGFSINLAASSDSLKVQGEENITTFQATVKNPEDKSAKVSTARRNFCKKCGSMLWLYDPTWPELIHPFASAVDTELPVPPERTHIMLDFKPSWVDPKIGDNDKKHARYPEESIADWHARLNLGC
ncbi:hypothetical protein KP509_32G004600 [Ceratopteris richardii]|uniref:CENP-V/GFA domain-containing protein n=1 Tax=Ceratopteris richardii TaxID=49495 RepID=A0A8T2QSB7_CERRI|nr:hypothetical protein KP509_32G004600 [Ceratopteris richardii]